MSSDKDDTERQQESYAGKQTEQPGRLGKFEQESTDESAYAEDCHRNDIVCL